MGYNKVDVANLITTPPPKPESKHWTIRDRRPKEGAIYLYNKEHDYLINIEGDENLHELLDWIFHMNEKIWCKGDILCELINHIQTIAEDGGFYGKPNPFLDALEKDD